jgi:hypothetical protein
MNKQHKEETINKIIMAMGDDIGSTFLNRLKPLLDLAYEASYNQAIKDGVARLSTIMPEQWLNSPTVRPVDINKGCPLCGISADDKAKYGYVCTRNDCPTKVTFHV